MTTTYRELIRLSGWTQMAEQLERRGTRSAADLKLLRFYEDAARRDAARQLRESALREAA